MHKYGWPRTLWCNVLTENELATLYHDESVLENHHIAVAFRLLLVCVLARCTWQLFLVSEVIVFRTPTVISLAI